MRILILFATVEGQTGKIARFVETEVRAAGHEVERIDLADPAAPVTLDKADKIILAAPVHERRHPEGFEVLLAGQREALGQKDTLLISVSLKAAFAEGRKEAADYLTEMEMRTGFKPDTELLVAGAVRTGSYDYFASQVLRHVVLSGHDHSPDDGDHEFTDWAALRNEVQAFLAG